MILNTRNMSPLKPVTADCRDVAINRDKSRLPRRGSIVVLAAVFLVVILAFTAFSIDTGYMLVIKTELQSAADGAALASAVELSEGKVAVQATAREVGALNNAGGSPINIANADIKVGFFDVGTKAFAATDLNPNAVRVTTRVVNKPYFFAPVLQSNSFNLATTAIAIINPRDIVFLVDLSGSMNDDTEPIWGTPLIEQRLAPMGYSGTSATLIQNVYSDFGFGTYPGDFQYLGEPLGVQQSAYAYAEMTKDDGPLTCDTLDAWYRITNSDNELTRREKCYRWIIDNQIKIVMPQAIPPADSHTQYDYWQRYIDYIMEYAVVGDAPPDTGGGGGGEEGGGGGGGPTPPTPPAGLVRPVPAQNEKAEDPRSKGNGNSKKNKGSARAQVGADPKAYGYFTTPGCGAVSFTSGMPRNGMRELVVLPPGGRINNMYGYNNPNFSTFPEADWSYVWNNTLRIGYKTYVQFMMDFGRESTNQLSDSGVGQTPLSVASSYCRLRPEATAGGSFNFPPREQPMHAARRSLIAALQVVKEFNAGVPGDKGDWVSVVTFDAADGTHAPQVRQPLTADFAGAMQACTTLQSVWDNGTTTGTDNGLQLARDHLRLPAEGGLGRSFATKVIVLLSDGVPNVWVSTPADVAAEQAVNPSADYYGADYIWMNAPLMQTSKFERLQKGKLYAVGMGLGADLDFMDRLARMAKTAKNGQSPRGAGNPAEYEARLTAIFTEIIRNPGVRLVK